MFSLQSAVIFVAVYFLVWQLQRNTFSIKKRMTRIEDRIATLSVHMDDNFSEILDTEKKGCKKCSE